MTPTLKTINIGGVPEHFNMPWHIAIANKSFEKVGLNIVWHDYPTGTGAMCTDLNNNTLDIALVLTEGVIADIAKGSKLKIAQTYVTSPLQWGVHAAYNSQINVDDDVSNLKFAISRKGSGSHLMAYVHTSGKTENKITEDNFLIVNNIDGAAEALTNNKADLFLWEKYTTQPFVEKQIFKRIDICPTPWPCFVMAVSENAQSNLAKEITLIQEVINNTTKSIKSTSDLNVQISEKYNLPLSQVDSWLKEVVWNSEPIIQDTIIEQVQETLFNLNLIPQILETAFYKI